MEKYCFLLVLTWALALTPGLSQDMLGQKVSIQFSNEELEPALFRLSAETGLNLAFSSEILPDKRIARKFRRTPVRQILQYLLGGTLVRFQQVGNQIVLYRLDPEETPSTFTVSGFLREKDSGEFVIGAYVQDKISGHITFSNEYGFYSLTLPAGTIDLSYTYQAHEMERLSLYLDRDYRLNLELNTSVTLNEIVVVPIDSIPSAVRQQWPGVDDLSPTIIESVPSLAGEPDIIRTTHLLPGVQTGTDGVGGIFVRGGNAGHNLILIDGVPVYNVSHAAGLFSIFNTNAIRTAKLLKGGFPARYGGRLSSILDIRTKEGNKEEVKGELEAGLLTGRFSLEGPLHKEKSSFFISGRRSFLNWYVDRQARKYKEEQGERGSTSYKFYDLNFKVNYTFSEKDRVYLSYYQGVDRFDNSGQATDVIALYDDNLQWFNYFRYDQSYSDGLDWGNKVGAARWNHLFNPKLFANTTLTFSNLNLVANYFSLDSLLLLNPPVTLAKSLDIGRYHSSIEDVGAKIDFNWIPNATHNVRFGGSLTHHRFEPGALSLGESISNEEIEQIFANDRITSLEYALYGEDSFFLGNDSLLYMNVGVHTSLMEVRDKWYVNLQPRFSAYWQWSDRLSLKISGGRMVQYLHLLSSSSIGLPTDLWVPSTNYIRPEEAWQASFGFDQLIGPQRQFKLEVEGYYKKMNNLLSFSEGASFLNNWEDNVTSGHGHAYGLDVMLRKSYGPTSGWLAYSLSWSHRQFERINLGRPYPFRYDRRHSLKLVLNQRLAKWIDFSANWIVTSGFAYSLALSEYMFQAEPDAPPIKVKDFGEKNQYRMPYYHRLDVGFNLNFASRNSDLGHQLRLGAYNVYNHQNPLYYNLRSKFIEENNELREVKELIEVQMLPILPSVSYSFKF